MVGPLLQEQPIQHPFFPPCCITPRDGARGSSSRFEVLRTSKTLRSLRFLRYRSLITPYTALQTPLVQQSIGLHLCKVQVGSEVAGSRLRLRE
ncbi:hypothetical protein CROQUDRAFT_657747 [Cronartium quercuum f. sp. fusiforme G11]|uniref:Uncharacterized protein n=1 Tax=Cronartium quercuum f. sp. fusiforme G11 TaxID=708437 RepID=A0A9P6NME2_9BASI|nr:hypothetical protein CROQUDRAFT_657747 [Cronartium quercuum f. sp. fusiforme G11]